MMIGARLGDKLASFSIGSLKKGEKKKRNCTITEKDIGLDNATSTPTNRGLPLIYDDK